MSVTVPDDDWIRSHDEAEQLLRYACLGATVVIEPIHGERVPESRRFTVVLDAAPEFATSCQEIYSLPALGGPIARRARTLCDRAVEALRRHRRM